MGFQKMLIQTLDTKGTLVYGQLLTESVTQTNMHKLHLLPRQQSDFCSLQVAPATLSNKTVCYLEVLQPGSRVGEE